MFNMLESLQRRELFLVPESSCYVTSSSQEGFVDWFCLYIVWVLLGMEVCNPELKKETTRKGAMLSIRYRRSNRELASGVPGRVRGVIEIVSDWPTVPFRSCRYL